MGCRCKNPYHNHSDSQLGGFGQGDFSLIDALKDPDATIAKYKEQAMDVGIKVAVAFAGILLVGNYLMLHQALNQKIKKIRRAA